MTTTKIKYSASINILRDADYDFNYIVTPNAVEVFKHLFSDVLKGTKVHTIIGAYGSGKSAFLLATIQTLTKTRVHFKNFEKLIKQLPEYEFINIIGEYSSFKNCLANELNLTEKIYSSKDVLEAINKRLLLLKRNGKGLAIIVDEFGKFLEYAAKYNPESELYFIQQLAELVNNTSNDMLCITTLHQNFNAYAVGLNKSQQYEWDKVKGRLKDIVFNEPVEQLLYLAAERILQKLPNQKTDNQFDKLFECIDSSKAFPLRSFLEKEFAKKLLPFDILSAAVLTLALQKYGQNERSLFSFIESDDYLGIYDLKNGKHYSLPQVYDYLINNFYSVLTTSRNNPDYNQWSSIRTSLEKIEGVLKEDILNDAATIIKTIGLLNIFSNASGRLDFQFYCTYTKLALGIKNSENIIKELVKFEIIRYTKHNFRYSLVNGTDVDIDLAIDEAGRIVEKVTNVVHYLNQFFDFPFISAKAVSYKRGIPRFFQFKLSEEPIKQIPEGEVDGFINLIFKDDTDANNKIEEVANDRREAILYGYYNNTEEITKLLYEIQKIRAAISTHKNDKIAMKQFEGVENHYRQLLNHYVLDSLYSNQGNIKWYYRGRSVTITNKQSFNQMLSSICEDVYSSVPSFKNELINKTKISGQIAFARKKLVERLLFKANEENLGFTDKEFPPEKSIYLALVKETGIHHKKDTTWQLDKPTNVTFILLWEAGNRFLDSTKVKERNLQDFIDILSTKPFKLKKGFIDYWIPLFLLIRNNEYALYESDSYIPELSGDVFDLMNKKPGLFKIKAFDVAGIRLELFNRYRIILNQSENHQPNNKVFIQTIKPFLVFYKELPEYSKNTSRLSKKTLALRQSIATAKDPEKVFFEHFPTALGYSLQELQNKPKIAEQFIMQLQNSIKELRTNYDDLVDRFENYFIIEVLGSQSQFPYYKEEIKKRYQGLKTHLLLPQQKSFFARLQSELDDRKAWLASIAQSCLGKPLMSITDEDEVLLYEKLRDIVYELDNLSEISKEQINDDKEEILKLEITSFIQGLNKNLLRIPKGKSKEIEGQIQKIKTNLGKDKKMNIASLTKLLQELLKYE